MTYPLQQNSSRQNPAMQQSSSMFGFSREALTEAVTARKQPSYRAKQLFQNLYARGEKNFDNMTALPLALRNELSENFSLARPSIVDRKESKDGTKKWLLQFADGARAETVYIPEKNRGTLCLSSQVGCTLNCRFCHTGTQKLVRNLSAQEILEQVACVKDELNDWQQNLNKPPNNSLENSANRKITNIVMMGMGEPLYNFENVAAALNILMDAEGFCISRRKITLSTAGVVPMIARVGQELAVQLAISLHAVSDEIRDTIVPLNRKYPLNELLQACREYPRLKNSERITFEYVMLDQINDHLSHARKLVQLIRGIPAKINLIPFNHWPNSPYRCSPAKRMHEFAEIIQKAGYSAPLRRPRGSDILAACGQLRTESIKKRKSEKREPQTSESSENNPENNPCSQSANASIV